MENKEKLIILRKHLRVVWKSHATASSLISDIIEPEKALFLKPSKRIHSVESSAYLYLIASNNFLRTADKIIKLLENQGLKRMKENINSQFPDHKTSRDILEHFEEYAIGEGRLQKQGKELDGDQLIINIAQDGSRVIKVFNLGEIVKSQLDWRIDGLVHFLERNIHEHLDPETPWPGWLPDRY